MSHRSTRNLSRPLRGRQDVLEKSLVRPNDPKQKILSHQIHPAKHLTDWPPGSLYQLRRQRNRIRGVGSALFYLVTSIAAHLQANVIWAEATQNSAEIYRKWFGREDIKDLVHLSPAEYTAFKTRIEDISRSKKTPPS
jgi:hypothetical protein